MGKPIPELRDANWLRDQYEGAHRRTVEIAADLGCDPATVATALRRHGIAIRYGNIRHGHKAAKTSGTPTYVSWLAMWSRCTNRKVRQWKWYGARGITVCDRWKAFENFLADMGERPKGLTLDRIDGNGNYEPANCRWATWSERRRNRAATERG